MILLTERLDQQLKNCLQRQIQITVRDRRLGAGKLLLYRIDGFYIQFTIQVQNVIEYVEIPYPFNTILENGDKTLIFDYRLESLAEKDFNLLFALQSISKKRESKFYNCTLDITQV